MASTKKSTKKAARAPARRVTEAGSSPLPPLEPRERLEIYSGPQPATPEPGPDNQLLASTGDLPMPEPEPEPTEQSEADAYAHGAPTAGFHPPQLPMGPLQPIEGSPAIAAKLESAQPRGLAGWRQYGAFQRDDARRVGIPTRDLVTVFQQLSAPFPPEHIEWRIGQSGVKDESGVWAKALAYIDNRGVLNRLDQVVGPENWREEFKQSVFVHDGEQLGGFLCGISLLIDGEWVTKWDGADLTDTEAFKGGLSGAEKRAAVKWGVGRYLYYLEASFVTVLANPSKDEKYATGVHYQPKSKARGDKPEVPAFYWREPQLPAWALPGGSGHPAGELPPPVPLRHRPSSGPTHQHVRPSSDYGDHGDRSGQPVASAEVSVKAFAPSEKQVAFYENLIKSSVFTEEERKRALEWLATKATRQTIKDQIDWLKRQVETRKANPTPPAPAAPVNGAGHSPHPSPEQADAAYCRTIAARVGGPSETQVRDALGLIRLCNKAGMPMKEEQGWYNWLTANAKATNIEAALTKLAERESELSQKQMGR